MQVDDRDESAAERLDRHWVELIQELRVAQTGIQVLAGFLLTIPFSARFTDLPAHHRALYLVAVALAVVTVALMSTPVALHRFLFGRQRKDDLVRASDLLARAGLATMGLTLVAVVTLVFAVVLDDVAGVVAGAVALVLYLVAWVAVPWTLLRTG